MSDPTSKASPYRKVSISTWADEKVRNLSPAQPSGQSLFLALLVGPQTTNVPGVQPVGRMALAEMLDWDLKAFDEAFAEVFREGLVIADWKARLIFVPKAISHNLPQSPNVVKSWASTWARVPECDLKRQAWEVIHAALSGMGPAYVEAFKSACPLDFCNPGLTPSPKPSRKASGKASRKASGKPSAEASGKVCRNQEQEQEQEQKDQNTSSHSHAHGTAHADQGGVKPDGDPEPPPPAGPPGSPGHTAPYPAPQARKSNGALVTPPKPEYPEAFESAWRALPKRLGSNSKRDAYKAWRARLREGVQAEDLRAGAERYAAHITSTRKTGTEFVMMGATFFGPGEHYKQSWATRSERGNSVLDDILGPCGDVIDGDCEHVEERQHEVQP